MVLGVTGLSGSGKNTAAAFFEQRGYFHIDMDVLGHQALKTLSYEISIVFPSTVQQGEVDRVALGQIVFKNRKKMVQLEGLTHPWMKQEATHLLSKHPKAIINAALIFSMQLETLCDAVLVIKTGFWTRFHRLKARKPMKTATILGRMIFQHTLRYQKKSSCADIHIVANNGTQEELFSALNALAAKEGWI